MVVVDTNQNQKEKQKRLDRTSWDENFKQLLLVNNDLMSYYPYISNGKYEELSNLDLEDMEIQKEIVNSSHSYSFYEWLVLQKELYEKKQLQWKRIEKLQKINFLPQQEQFNTTDLKIYNDFCRQIKPKPKRKGMKIFEYPLEDQLYLVKKHIDTYYYSSNLDNYDLSDYIQEAILGLARARQKYNNFVVNYPVYVTFSIFKQLDNFLINNKQQDVNLNQVKQIPSSINLEDEYFKKVIYHNLDELLKTLSAREEKILRLHFGLVDGIQHPREEIGKLYKVSGEAIRAREVLALRKLRHPGRSALIRQNSILFSEKGLIPLYLFNQFKNLIMEDIILNIKNSCDVNFKEKVKIIQKRFSGLDFLIQQLINIEEPELLECDELIEFLKEIINYISSKKTLYKKIVFDLIVFLEEQQEKRLTRKI